MLEQRMNNYQHSNEAVLSDPSHEIARVFLSNRIGEMVIYRTEEGHLSFGLQSSDEDNEDQILRS